jgi:hypothetical protein
MQANGALLNLIALAFDKGSKLMLTNQPYKQIFDFFINDFSFG